MPREGGVASGAGPRATTRDARDASPGVTRGFCGDCGTPLTLADARFPGEVYIAAASLDDPEALPPEFHIWRSERLSWLETADALPRYRRFKVQGELEE